MPNQISLNEVAGPDKMSVNHEDSGDIDLSTLTAFQVMQSAGEPDLVVELIDLYLKDGTERLQQIKHAAVTGDRTLLKKAAHTLKGSSGSLGFHQILELCERLERIEGSDNTKALVQKLESKFASVCTALHTFRQSRINAAQTIG